jgi:hypothetical protein
MMATVTVEVLDQLTARRLVSEARNALALSDDLLARLYAGRAWEALGHADWPALCAAELPELRHLKLRAGPRRDQVGAMADARRTVRDVAAAFGTSVWAGARPTCGGARRSSPGPGGGRAQSGARPGRRAGHRGRAAGADDPPGSAAAGLDLRGDVGGAVPRRAPRAGDPPGAPRPARRVPSLHWPRARLAGWPAWATTPGGEHTRPAPTQQPRPRYPRVGGRCASPARCRGYSPAAMPSRPPASRASSEEFGAPFGDDGA